MSTVKKRKEVSLDSDTIAILDVLAKKDGRTLKNYLEYVIKLNADQFKLTDDYKVMMDEMLERHDSNSLQYLNEEDFIKSL